jgi:hypothetical protein
MAAGREIYFASKLHNVSFSEFVLWLLVNS